MNIDEVDINETNEYMELSSTYTTRAYKANAVICDILKFENKEIRLI